jgi:hypothetical protein
MFTTFVMACSMLTGQCIIAEDDWGFKCEEQKGV